MKIIQEHTPSPGAGEFESVAVRTSMVSIIGNLILSLFKLLAGILGHSGAMVSDAVHSASDVFSSIIVIIGVRISGKTADRDHPYGHERFECVAAIVLSVVLLITGLWIGYTALENIVKTGAQSTEIPGLLALIAAIVSILSKEAMFRYTRHRAAKIHSDALMAEAWHHRSDALSSVGAMVGILGARLGRPVLDPVASLIICLFIAKAAYDIFRDAINKMVDHSCSEETEQQIRSCAENQDGVLGIDLLQSRVFGNRIYVDMEIAVDAELTLTAGHAIAEQVHDAIEQRFPDIKHIMIHVNPCEPEDHHSDDKS